MDGEPTTARPTGNDGLLQHLRQAFASLTGYFGARFELVAIESQEAFVHYLKLLALVAAAAIAVVFGYFLLCFAAVFLVAQLTGIAWMWVTLGAGLAHVVGCAICLLAARAMLKVPMFEVTLDELKKDREWLR